MVTRRIRPHLNNPWILLNIKCLVCVPKAVQSYGVMIIKASGKIYAFLKLWGVDVTQQFVPMKLGCP